MCTVTYLPTSSGPVITSSRDEKYTRKPALAPATTMAGNLTLAYPIDTQAGGTWIAARNDRHIAVLLNGAFANHTPTGNYRQSRGLLLLEAMKKYDPIDFIEQYDLANIEPFTLIAFADGELAEYRWDAIELYKKKHDGNQKHIWSSATLYNGQAILKRELWFKHWFQKEVVDPADIWQFHLHAGKEDPFNKIFMDRTNDTRTVSITMVSCQANLLTMKYRDVMANDLQELMLKMTAKPTMV